MSAPLKLSHNELSALLKYVFQGLFGHTQDWGALAGYVQWLETHGFRGVDLLIEALNAETLNPFDGTASQTPEGYDLDFKGMSLLMGLPSIVDLSAAYTHKIGRCVVTITRASQLGALVATEGALLDMGLYAHIETASLTCQLDPCHTRRDYLNRTSAYKTSLIEGVEIDRHHYERLNKIAEGTLVQSSEASRRGAGE